MSIVNKNDADSATIDFLGEFYAEYPAAEWTIQGLTDHLHSRIGHKGIIVALNNHIIHPHELLEKCRAYEYVINFELTLRLKQAKFELKKWENEARKSAFDAEKSEHEAKKSASEARKSMIEAETSLIILEKSRVEFKKVLLELDMTKQKHNKMLQSKQKLAQINQLWDARMTSEYEWTDDSKTVLFMSDAQDIPKQNISPSDSSMDSSSIYSSLSTVVVSTEPVIAFDIAS